MAKMIQGLQKKLLSAFIALTQSEGGKDLVVQLNDSGMSFNDIANYLDQLHGMISSDLIEY
jgi:hypothetical protein